MKRKAVSQVVTRPVHPNAGTEARYRRALLDLIAEMTNSVEFWLTKQRRSDPPELAEDATTPSISMRKELSKIAKRWQKRFDMMAPQVARSFLQNQFRGTDLAMRQALRDAGWSVKFEMTPEVRDAFEASLAENVGLIRSIPQQYLQQVEGIVMRNYARGADIGGMTKEIRILYPKIKDRAALIARDQSSKANAVVTRARQKELNITQAVWLHSHAGRKPRPTHVAMNGKRYDVAKGMYDSAVKAFVFPSELINCRCVSRSVLPWMPAEKR